MGRSSRCCRCSSSTRLLSSSCSSSSSSPGCARPVHGQECWTFQLCPERVRTVQTVQKTVLVVDVPVISSDKFPQSRGSNPLAPDSAHPQSGEHSCCATDFRRIPQVQFLVVWDVVDMPVYVQRQAPCFYPNFLIVYVTVDSDPEAASMEFHGSSHLKI